MIEIRRGDSMLSFACPGFNDRLMARALLFRCCHPRVMIDLMVQIFHATGMMAKR
jgi:hypothetical protein